MPESVFCRLNGVVGIPTRVSGRNECVCVCVERFPVPKRPSIGGTLPRGLLPVPTNSVTYLLSGIPAAVGDKPTATKSGRTINRQRDEPTGNRVIENVTINKHTILLISFFLKKNTEV